MLTSMQSVFCVPQSDSVTVEILLAQPVDFKVDMHLPVFQVTRLDNKTLQKAVNDY